jgi:hypothetical protein
VTAEATAAQLETDTPVSHVDVDKSYIARAPAAVSSRAMEENVTSTPGFTKDENGRFHFQGAHSQSEYVVDGQTISDQTGVTFSNSIDPGIAESLEIIYGNVPAEYGEKTAPSSTSSPSPGRTRRFTETSSQAQRGSPRTRVGCPREGARRSWAFSPRSPAPGPTGFSIR